LWPQNVQFDVGQHAADAFFFSLRGYKLAVSLRVDEPERVGGGSDIVADIKKARKLSAAG